MALIPALVCPDGWPSPHLLGSRHVRLIRSLYTKERSIFARGLVLRIVHVTAGGLTLQQVERDPKGHRRMISGVAPVDCELLPQEARAS